MIRIAYGNIYDNACDLLVIPYSILNISPSHIAMEFAIKKIPQHMIKPGEVYFRTIDFSFPQKETVNVAVVFDTESDNDESSGRLYDIGIIEHILLKIKAFVINKKISSINLFAFRTRNENFTDADFVGIVTKIFNDIGSIQVAIYAQNVITMKKEIDAKNRPIDHEDRKQMDTTSISLDHFNNMTGETLEKKYQIFVSSTYSDLIDERKEATQALLESGCIPVGMELFPASNKKQWEMIKSVIDDCDAYILILAGRYGSMGKDDNEILIGYTEMEFDYAIATNKPILAFLHNNIGSIEANKVESNDDGKKRLYAFYEKAKNGRLIKYWSNKDNLKAVIFQSIMTLIKVTPMVGWVRDTKGSLHKEKNDAVNDNILQGYKNELSIAQNEIAKQHKDLVELSNQVSISRVNSARKDDEIKKLEKKLEEERLSFELMSRENINLKGNIGKMFKQFMEWANQNGISL